MSRYEPGKQFGKRILGGETRMNEDFEMRVNLSKKPLWLGHSEQSGELQEMDIEKLESNNARPGRITKGTKL